MLSHESHAILLRAKHMLVYERTFLCHSGITTWPDALFENRLLCMYSPFLLVTGFYVAILVYDAKISWDLHNLVNHFWRLLCNGNPLTFMSIVLLCSAILNLCWIVHSFTDGADEVLYLKQGGSH